MPEASLRTRDDVDAVRRLFHGHCLRTAAAEPKVFHAPRTLAVRADLVWHVECKNAPLPKVVERLGAFRICAMTHHASFSLCAAEFPRFLSAGPDSEALMKFSTWRDSLDSSVFIWQYGAMADQILDANPGRTVIRTLRRLADETPRANQVSS